MAVRIPTAATFEAVGDRGSLIIRPVVPWQPWRGSA
jgi:hypothetical protein